jgi:hypothetical protein
VSRPTRVCTKCRHRKYLTDFYKSGDRRWPGYRSQCKSCTKRASICRARVHPRRRAPKLTTFRCQYCEAEEMQRCANQRTCHRITCQQAQRREQKQRMKLKSPSGVCVDCGHPAYFSRCEFCRIKHQQAVEEAFTRPSMSDLACQVPTRTGACLEILTFGCDRLGRSTVECRVHGERLMPTIGQRSYDQRETLSDELDEFIERASAPPDGRFRSYGSGMHFRQKSHEYVRRSA